MCVFTVPPLGTSVFSMMRRDNYNPVMSAKRNVTFSAAMRALGSAGSERCREIYRRHGVRGAMFGVGFADYGAIAKKAGRDQALAEALWASGNHDARVLATMAADPAAMSEQTLDAWARDLDNSILTDAFSARLAAKTPFLISKMELWTASGGEWIASAGWNLLAALATHDKARPDSFFEARVRTIEKAIHGAKNRARYAMNGALIAIGLRNERLRKLAIAAAGRIGPVEVDHGDTGCKTPDAAVYIEQASAKLAARGAKKSGAKKA